MIIVDIRAVCKKVDELVHLRNELSERLRIDELNHFMSELVFGMSLLFFFSFPPSPLCLLSFRLNQIY